MARIFRQVDVVVQNHTQEMLTVEGGINMEGEWNAPGPPKIGAIVAKQSSAKWSTISTEMNVGAAGTLRFGCTKGYIDIRWRLPMDATDFHCPVEAPAALKVDTLVISPNLDHRIVLLTITPA